MSIPRIVFIQIRAKFWDTKYLVHNNRAFEYPFLTVIAYAGNEYLGILQNIDTQICTMYVFDRLKDVRHKRQFLGKPTDGCQSISPC